MGVEYDVVAQTAWSDWELQTVMTCTLADGRTFTDEERRGLGSIAPQTPAVIAQTMFMATSLPEAPATCTSDIALVDRSSLVRERLGLRCWRGSLLEAGPCTADP